MSDRDRDGNNGIQDVGLSTRMSVMEAEMRGVHTILRRMEDKIDGNLNLKSDVAIINDRTLRMEREIHEIRISLTASQSTLDKYSVPMRILLVIITLATVAYLGASGIEKFTGAKEIVQIGSDYKQGDSK